MSKIYIPTRPSKRDYNSDELDETDDQKSKSLIFPYTRSILIITTLDSSFVKLHFLNYLLSFVMYDTCEYFW